jgi:NAD-dependent deacetylase
MPLQLGSSRVEDTIRAAAALIRSARHLTAFTGADISVESGIPPFRGPGGLWGKYDARTLEIDNFLAHPETAWPVIKEIFYDHFGKARPNVAHLALARLEAAGGADGRGLLQCLITQNHDRKTRAPKMLCATTSTLSTLIISPLETP